jgi:hypothetical protein
LTVENPEAAGAALISVVNARSILQAVAVVGLAVPIAVVIVITFDATDPTV